MKRVALLLTLAALTAAVLTNANARTEAKRAVCHRTGSKTKPYVKLRVSAKQLAAHAKHAADLVPAPAGACPTTLLTATSGGRGFTVALTGEVESPDGDPVATGEATVRLRARQAQVCYEIDATNLPPASAAHIHRGSAGTSGNVVIPLKTPNAAGKSSGCATAARSLVNAILADPASYYVNVHTAEFPNGAIRGQLTGTSSDSLGRSFTLDLKGTSEPNAKGTAALRIRKAAGVVCYRLHAESVTLPTTAAHIHRGATGVNGPVVVPFTAPGANGNSSGCATATAAIIDEILANPSNFYVNVHTQEHPAGAIRSQLS
jgi:hypothetical protein